MRYKRVNTLALDVSSVPAGHRISTVQPFLTFLKLDPRKLRSVQVHSSRKTIYVGLPDDHSAAAIAAKTPRFSITIDGTKIHVPVVFVDEDIIDVRVRDVPPETPNDDIQSTLRKYGEVLSVTSEVWRDFFPGVLTGVRIARMKVSQNIPSFVRIGSSLALINYDGQTDTCSRCGEPKHPETQCKTADKKQKQQTPLPQDPQRPQNPREISGAAIEKKQQQQQQQPARASKTAPPAGNKTIMGKPHTVANNSDTSMEVDETASSGFTTVMRKKGKATHQQQLQQQQQQVSQDSSSVSRSVVPSEDDLRKRDAIIAALQAFGVPIDADADGNPKIKK